MALFVVRHQHVPARCPAQDPYMGATILNHLSRPNVRGYGVEIKGEAVVQGEHTVYLIVEVHAAVPDGRQRRHLSGVDVRPRGRERRMRRGDAGERARPGARSRRGLPAGHRSRSGRPRIRRARAGRHCRSRSRCRDPRPRRPAPRRQPHPGKRLHTARVLDEISENHSVGEPDEHLVRLSEIPSDLREPERPCWRNVGDTALSSLDLRVNVSVRMRPNWARLR